MKTKRPSNYDHYVKCDGVAAFVFDTRDGGHEITLSGWCNDRHKFKKGQRLLVCTDGQESRYRVMEADLPLDPPDQYFLRCKFDPRKAL